MAQHSKGRGAFDPHGEEACKRYGRPSSTSFGHRSLPVGGRAFGQGGARAIPFNPNGGELGGENRTLWLNGIAPVLLGLGLVGLFIEFKTPGFGIFGTLGLILLLVFFGSKYVAGLAGPRRTPGFSWGCAWWPLKYSFFRVFVARYRGAVVDRWVGFLGHGRRWPILISFGRRNCFAIRPSNSYRHRTGLGGVLCRLTNFAENSVLELDDLERDRGWPPKHRRIEKRRYRAFRNCIGLAWRDGFRALPCRLCHHRRGTGRGQIEVGQDSKGEKIRVIDNNGLG